MAVMKVMMGVAVVVVQGLHRERHEARAAARLKRTCPRAPAPCAARAPPHLDAQPRELVAQRAHFVDLVRLELLAPKARLDGQDEHHVHQAGLHVWEHQLRGRGGLERDARPHAGRADELAQLRVRTRGVRACGVVHASALVASAMPHGPGCVCGGAGSAGVQQPAALQDTRLPRQLARPACCCSAWPRRAAPPLGGTCTCQPLPC